jgi:hydrogenase nickel incorporation protein HypA/HybF
LHELPVTEKILDIVLAHAERNAVRQVVAIHLRVGALSDLEDEWIQHYFNYLARETVAAEAKLVIERVPVVMRCNRCAHTFEIDVKELTTVTCPQCKASDYTLISGRDYHIKHMEVI